MIRVWEYAVARSHLIMVIIKSQESAVQTLFFLYFLPFPFSLLPLRLFIQGKHGDLPLHFILYPFLSIPPPSHFLT